MLICGAPCQSSIHVYVGNFFGGTYNYLDTRALWKVGIKWEQYEDLELSQISRCDTKKMPKMRRKCMSMQVCNKQ